MRALALNLLGLGRSTSLAWRLVRLDCAHRTDDVLDNPRIDIAPPKVHPANPGQRYTRRQRSLVSSVATMKSCNGLLENPCQILKREKVEVGGLRNNRSGSGHLAL